MLTQFAEVVQFAKLTQFNELIWLNLTNSFQATDRNFTMCIGA